MSSNCESSFEAAAYLADELSEKERASFEQHLSVCPTCRAAVETSSLLIARLRSLPEVEQSRDLAPLILSRFNEPVREMPQLPWWPRVTAIAATIALVVGSSAMWQLGVTPSAGLKVALVDERTASVDRALDWFCEHQEADGSWDAEKWGGNARFQIALTALPLIALLEDPVPTPRRAAVANRAVAFLRERQNPDGTFGEPFREAPYIHSVTTLALLHAYQRQPHPELRRTLDAALKVVLTSQTAEGGWAYWNSSTPNLPITLWHKDVVELATTLGWKEMNSSLGRMTDWIAHQPADALLAEEQTGRAGTDYHRVYFAVVSLRGKRTAQALQKLTAIRHDLVLHQANQGAESGTWAPMDQWGRAGGRIYSTALASLALR